MWLTHKQLDRLAAAIDKRYRALVLVAALTGMRWGELAALRWDDLRLDAPLHDGAVGGPGRLRIARALSDPRRSGRGVEKGPKTEAGIRTIALDQETVDAFRAHRELVGGGAFARIFTTPGGSRGDGGTLSSNNFARVWKRALHTAELDHLWPEYDDLLVGADQLASAFMRARWQWVGGCRAVWAAGWDGCSGWPGGAGAAAPGRGTRLAAGGYLGMPRGAG